MAGPTGIGESATRARARSCRSEMWRTCVVGLHLSQSPDLFVGEAEHSDAVEGPRQCCGEAQRQIVTHPQMPPLVREDEIKLVRRQRVHRAPGHDDRARPPRQAVHESQVVLDDVEASRVGDGHEVQRLALRGSDEAARCAVRALS